MKKECECRICGKKETITADEETFEKYPQLSEYCGEHVAGYISGLTITNISFRLFK